MNLDGRSESFSEAFAYTLCNERNQPVDAKSVTTNADDIMLTLKIMRVKELPLEVEILYGGGATADNTTVTVEPASIWISGSDTVLAGLDKLVLGTVNLAELTEDEILKFAIKLPEGVNNESDATVTEAAVNVSFGDLRTKTVTLKSDFHVINKPNNVEIELLTQALEVQIRATEEELEKVQPEDFKVVVDLAGAQIGTSKPKAEITCSNVAVGIVGTYTVSVTLNQGE